MATFGDEWRRGRHSDHDAARGLTHTVCVYILATFPGCSPQWRRETRISGLPAWVCADFGASRPWVPNSVDLGCLLPNTPISGLPPESAPTLDSFPFLIELKSCDIWFTTTKNQTGVRSSFRSSTVWSEGSAPAPGMRLLLVLLAAVGPLPVVRALDNGVALVPPMGW
jgi:hypothetical protein